MIWLFPNGIGESFVSSFQDAGPINYSIFQNAGRAGAGSGIKQPGQPRWYYLYKQLLRVKLVTVAAPLADYLNVPAYGTVGTYPIEGEFEGQYPFIGQMGLAIRLEEMDTYRQSQKSNDQIVTFDFSMDALESISEQALDLAKPHLRPSHSQRSKNQKPNFKSRNWKQLW
jgi:hypothetical protein